MSQSKIDELSINTIRFLSIDAVQKANSGHPGMPMGCAPIAYTLYAKFMNHNPLNPEWINRDRFVLSAGHGSMLLYSTLHLCGYDITLDDLKNFRQWESITPGHPEYGLTPGIETTTGPLGQGFSNAVGMAIAQEYLASMFNKDDIKIIDHYIYGICSDGDLMEGITHESASLAGHLKLSKLIFFYDDNKITIDGSTSLAFSEDVRKRFEAYGWQVLNIDDVNDLEKISNALVEAKKDLNRPTLIITRTHIGYGSPNKQDTAEAHGSPLGDEEVKLTKENLNWPVDKTFYVPEGVIDHFKNITAQGKISEEKWDELFSNYKNKYPSETDQLLKLLKGDFGSEWEKDLPSFKDTKEQMATRSASGKVINYLARHIPTLIGGSADLEPSNNTAIKDAEKFSASKRSGRNFHFGIREHAMGGILNGIALNRGIIPYGGTFLVFSDYMRPAIRLASLSRLNTIYVFTHDSIGLGEDGPTHQPIEHLSALRAIPGLLVIRPCDANETSFAWKAAIKHRHGPAAIILTRQKLPVLDRDELGKAENLERGAYILLDTEPEPEIILIASGSEVYLALEAAKSLNSEGIKTRVVSFPCWELFELQDAEYKDSVLPLSVKARVSVEAGVKHGWEKYVGDFGESISIEKFGASAPYETIFKEYGFTVENIIKKAHLTLNKIEKA